MSAEDREEHKLEPVEQALRTLVPIPSRIDRDRLMYLAGQASVRDAAVLRAGRRWIWPAATAAMTLVSATLLWRAESTPPRIVNVPQHAQQKNTLQEPGRAGPEHVTQSAQTGPTRPGSLDRGALDGGSLSRVLAHGVDSFADASPVHTVPQTGAVSERPQTNRELLDDLLGNPRKVPDQPALFLLELFRLSGENL